MTTMICRILAWRLFLVALLIPTVSNGQSPADSQTIAGKNPPANTVPHCGVWDDAQDSMLPAHQFAEVVCARKDLLATLRQVDTLVKQLRPRLDPLSRIALDAQQAEFAQTPYNCPTGQTALARCIAAAVDQRLKDIQDLKADIDESPPDCAPADVSIMDGDVSDAGMSHQFSTYLIRYKGSAACRIRGYPTTFVSDKSGDTRLSTAIQSGNTSFTRLVGAPLPVMLSARNRLAWFGIQTVSACDSSSGLYVKVALPSSQEWLRTLAFPYANCSVAVTPVGMLSTLRSSVK
jgi:hypothetical protein